METDFGLSLRWAVVTDGREDGGDKEAARVGRAGACVRDGASRPQVEAVLLHLLFLPSTELTAV